VQVAPLGRFLVKSVLAISRFDFRPCEAESSILIHEVRVQNPDPVFAEELLEQYGGATGELSAALTYLTQGIRDMLQDIGTEELGHLEVIALLIEQHTSRASVSLLQIPTHRGHPLRFDRGQATDLMAATIPI
jgi:hypothetical protein